MENGVIPHPDITVPPKAEIASELLAGLLYGLTGAQDLPDLQQCFYDGDEFVADVTIALEDITSFTGAGIMNGFILGISTLAYIPVDVKDCMIAKDDALVFAGWATMFAHPQTFEATVSHNIKTHLPSLLMDIRKIKMDMGKNDWVKVGADFGEMLAIVTEPLDAEEFAHAHEDREERGDDHECEAGEEHDRHHGDHHEEWK
jgi:hypothetical protein